MALRQYVIVEQDSLQRIAQRELGDAALWWNLAVLNALEYPFVDTSLTPADRDESGRRVAVLGDPIVLPEPGDQDPVLDKQFAAPLDDFYDIIYKRDLELDPDGDLVFDAATGDLQLVTGVENLTGALRRRLESFRGELLYHRQYGSILHEIPGEPNDTRMVALTRIEVVQTLLRDPRWWAGTTPIPSPRTSPSTGNNHG
jgi:hypothetical protein